MEVLVVGRGFAGSIASLLSADRGYKTISVDDKPVTPHCTGIISRRLASLLSIESLILSEPEELLIRYGKLQTLIEAPKKAVVIDRESLDKLLREASEAAGAEAMRKRVKRISPDGRAYIDRELIFRRIIDAEGPLRGLSKQYFGSLGLLPGIQVDIASDRPEERVVIDLNIPGLFGWIVPLGGGKARVGVATRRPYMRLRYMLRGLRYRELSRRGGVVVISGPRGGLYRGKILLVGDAAGSPKPLTGGGLAFGLLNVIYAIRNLEDPKRYETEYMRLMSKEYKRQIFLRRLKELSRILPRLFYLPLKIASKISSSLDMDFRSGTRTYPSEDIRRIVSYLQGS